MKNVLITAYAVNPYKGSEDGTGWNISRELAKDNKLSIVTRKNNRAEIERYLAENNDPLHKNMAFYYYDLPWWMMFWKKRIGERGYVLYFYLWQLFLPLFVKSKGIKFDLSHAVNFHSDSHPQFLWTLGKPVFWGPIGHHPPVPSNYLNPIYGRKNWFKDRLYNAVKFTMRNFDPFYYISKWTAKRIFVINSGVNNAVGANKSKIIVMPAVANTSKREISPTLNTNKFNVLAVGRFVYMKGFDVTIAAFANFYHTLNKDAQKNVQLTLVGKGEELARMKRLIQEKNISNAVEIIHWVEKKKMAQIYASSSLFCFGSHEGAGMVIPEALSYGLPVVCFDNYGPGELCDDSCAIKIPYGNYNNSIFQFSQALHTLYTNKKKYNQFSIAATHYAKANFHWAKKATTINEAYAAVS